MKKLILVATILWAGGHSAWAVRTPAFADTKLVGMISEIQNADGYAYQTSIVSRLLTDTSQIERRTMTTYLSRQQQLFYSRSENEETFFCKAGMFKVDHQLKTVYYRQFVDSESVAAWQSIDRMRSTVPLDTFLLKEASVAVKKVNAGKVVYRLSYPKESMLRTVNISYVPQRFFESVDYVFYQAWDQEAFRKGDKSGVIEQRVTMNKYRKEIPERATLILAQAGDLSAFLTKAYPGFTLQVNQY